MKIFLTGGSGFVGGAVARTLGAKHQIIALSRSETSDRAILEAGARPLRGDLAAVEPAMLTGVDAVIHAAAHVEEWGPPALYRDVNVTGTERLLAAAKSAGVRRLVHVGTEAALFHGQHMRDLDETAPLAPHSPFPYSASKACAELLVRAAKDPARGFETIVIRPRLIWGEGDKTVLPVVREMAARGRFMWIDGGRALTSTTHIDNLVAAIELALTNGKSGEPYFVVDGPPTTFREFLTRYLGAAGVELPDKSIPGPVARGIANVVEPLFRLANSKSPPPVTRFAAYVMSRDCTINDARARHELGYRPVVSLDAGIERLAG